MLRQLRKRKCGLVEIVSGVAIVRLSDGGLFIADEADWFGLFNYEHRTGNAVQVRPCEWSWRAEGNERTQYPKARFTIAGYRPHVPIHRVIMGAMPGSQVDHRNRNTFDNRRSNLRWTNHSLNATNVGVCPTIEELIRAL